MTNQIFFGLFNLGLAIVLYTQIFRARKDKQLKITLISDPVTKVEKIVLTGRGLTVAITGFGISTTLLFISGLSALFAYTDLEVYFILLIIGFLWVFTMLIAGYVTTHFNE